MSSQERQSSPATVEIPADDLSCDPIGVAERLAFIGTVLFLVFLTLLLSEILPLRLLDPAWQLGLIQQLLRNAPLPLLGLGLLHLAVVLDPFNPRLVQRRNTAARLALSAALGFLLLVPLLGLALVQGRLLHQAQQDRHAMAMRQLDQVGEAVEAARSSTDLKRRLAAVKAPALPASEAALPLGVLRSRLRSDLFQARQALDQRLRPPPAEPVALLLRQHLRTLVLALIFALAFASAAQARGSLRSPLEQWALSWQQSRVLAAERGRIRQVYRRRLRRLRQERNRSLRMVPWHLSRSRSSLPSRSQSGLDPDYVAAIHPPTQPQSPGG